MRLSTLLFNLSHSKLLARNLNRLYYHRFGLRNGNPNGIDIFDEDWDNLIILDACRYDVFNEHHSLPGRLSKKESKASSTTEFLKTNFSGKDLRDTVYITANPQFLKYRERFDTQFHAVEHVWKEEDWDEEYGTVLPEVMTKRVLKSVEQYPDKRILGHYMQPHYPFIGTGTEFDKGHLTGEKEHNIWMCKMIGESDVPSNEIWDAYCQNLNEVLPHLEELFEGLDGKTVITSDHGNLFGERVKPIPIREWVHPKLVYHPDLVEVPWLEYTSGSRRKIAKGNSFHEEENTDTEKISNRLESLGYIN